MGYTTEFSGRFEVDRRLDDATFALLTGLASTRRLARFGLSKEYGEEGEFYYKDDGNYGQDDNTGVPEGGHNTPPKSQPGLWCQWHPVRGDDGHDTIEWDGGEKFYDYVEWITYIIDRVLKPAGYQLNGQVKWQGEDMDDRGLIMITANVVTTKQLE